MMAMGGVQMGNPMRNLARAAALARLGRCRRTAEPVNGHGRSAMGNPMRTWLEQGAARWPMPAQHR